MVRREMILKGLTASAVIFGVSLAITFLAWNHVSDEARIPIHWGIDGAPDRFGGKVEALLAIPAVMAALIPILAILPLIDPRRENLERSAGFYFIAWVGGLLISLFAHGAIVWGAVTATSTPVEIVFVGVAVFIMALGNAMAKSRSNWFAGLRTPWTLSSEHAWSVGNRLAGWCFVLTGVATIAAVFFLDLKGAVAVQIGGLLASILVATVASYFAWRSDPDRAV